MSGPARPAHEFDHALNPCMACMQKRPGEECVQCMTCEVTVHTGCYPSAKADMAWECDMCDVKYVEACCVLCNLNSQHGVLVRLSKERVKELAKDLPPAVVSTIEKGEFAFVHSFCQALYTHPSANKLESCARFKCVHCSRPMARLSCALCVTSFHPPCALHETGVLTHTPSGHIDCYCAKHQSARSKLSVAPRPLAPVAPRPAAAAAANSTAATAAASTARPAAAAAASSTGDSTPHSPAVSSRKPVTVKREPGTEHVAAAAAAPVPSVPARPTSSVATPMANGKSTTAAAKPSAVATTAAKSPIASAAAAKSPPAAAAAAKSPPAAAAPASAKSPTVYAAAASSNGTSISSKKAEFLAQQRGEHKSERKHEDKSDKVTPAAATSANGNTSHARAPPVPTVPKLSKTLAASAASSSSASAIKPLTIKNSAGTPVAPAKSSAKSSMDESISSLKKPALTKTKPASAAASSSAAAAAAPASSARAAKPSTPPKKKVLSTHEKAAASAAAAAAASPAKRKPPSTAASRRSSVSSDSSDEVEWTGGDVSEESARRLERHALKQIKEQHENEQDIPEGSCRVCGESWEEIATDDNGDPIGNDEDGNNQDDMMVICEGCEESYHQSCYGIKRIPEGDYFCWPCAKNKKRGEVQCVICKGYEWRGFCEVQYDPAHTDKAVLKAHKKQKHFAHTYCTLWNSETWFGDPERRNPACGVENIPPASYKLSCIKCPRKDGAKLQCQHKTCVLAWHPLCMQKNPQEFFSDEHAEDPDLTVEAAAASSSASSAGERPGKEWYCPHHSTKVRRQRERAKLVAEGKDTTELDDAILLDTERVVPTTALLPAHKLVGVVAPRQGRGKRVYIPVDLADQEERAAESKEAEKQLKVKIEELDDDEKVDATRRKRKAEIDADIESVNSSDSSDSESSRQSRKRLRKEPKLKLEYGAAAAAPADMEIVNTSNELIETRKAVRTSFTTIFSGNNSLAVVLEQALFDKSGRRTTSDTYRDVQADLKYNLQHNAELLRRVMNGAVTVPQLLSMSSAEMATPALQKKRQEESKEQIRERTLAPQAVIITSNGRRLAIDAQGHRVEKEQLEEDVQQQVTD